MKYVKAGIEKAVQATDKVDASSQKEEETDSKAFWMPEERKTVQEMYTDLSNRYETFVSSGDVNMQANPVMLELMCKYWPRCNNNNNKATAATLLDIGCGTGLIGKLFMERAKQEGFFATDTDRTNTILRGIDISPGMLSKVDTSTLYSDALQHDVDHTPWPMFPDKCADMSICNAVLIYLHNPAVLDEFVRTTKKGGTCLLMMRHDVNAVFVQRSVALEKAGQWKLVKKSDDRDNFPGLTADGLEPTLFNIFVYQVLV